MPNRSWKHKLAELVETSQWDELIDHLCDLSSFEENVKLESIIDLAKLYSKAVRKVPVNQPRRELVSLIDQAISLDYSFLSRHSECLFQCLWNRCWWHDCDEIPHYYDSPKGDWPTESQPWQLPPIDRISPLLEGWRKEKEQQKQFPDAVWIRSMRPLDEEWKATKLMDLRAGLSTITAIAISADGKAIVAGGGNGICLWNADGKIRTQNQGLASPVLSVAFHMGGANFISGNRDRIYVFPNIAEGEPIDFPSIDESPVISIASPTDGKYLAIGHRNGIISILSKSGSVVKIRHPTAILVRIVFSPDGHLLISLGLLDATLRFWNPSTGEQVNSVELKQDDMEWSGGDIVFSPDGTRIAAALGGILIPHVIRVWSLKSVNSLRHDFDIRHSCQHLAFYPDGQRIVSGTRDGSIHVWDLETGTESFRWKAQQRAITDVAVFPDGRRIATGSVNGTVRIWAAKKALPLRLRSHSGKIGHMEFCPDGDWLATGSEDGTVRIWNAFDGTERACLRASLSRSASEDLESVLFAIAPDGSRIVTAGLYGDGHIRVWETRSFTELLLFEQQDLFTTSITFSLDGRLIITSSNDLPSGEHDETPGIIRIWDTEDGHLISTLQGHKDTVSCVVFAPDGTRIASASHDGTVRIWEVGSGRTLAQSSRHKSPVLSLAFSPNGKQIACGCDGEVRIVNTSNGHDDFLISEMRFVEQISLRSDGQVIFSTINFDSGKTLQIWDTLENKCLEIVQAIGDVKSEKATDPEHLWHARLHDSEIVIKELATDQEVAWSPTSGDQILSHPHKPIWAVADGNNLLIFRLDKISGIFSSSSDWHSPARSASELQLIVSDLLNGNPDWEDIWMKLDPYNTPAFKQQLSRLRSSYMLNPKMALRIIQIGCEKAKNNNANSRQQFVSRFDAMREAFRESQPFDDLEEPNQGEFVDGHIQDVITLLKDSAYVTVRETAAQELGGTRFPSEAVIQALQRSLVDTSPRVRYAATTVLGQFGPTAYKAAFALSQTLLNDQEQLRIKERAAFALGQIGSSGAVFAVPSLVVSLSKDCGWKPAWETLDLIAPALMAKVRALNASNESRFFEGLGGVLENLGSPAIPLLLACSEDTVYDRTRASAEKLANIGGSAIPHLISALMSDNSSVCSTAALALELIGPEAQSATQGILKAIEYSRITSKYKEVLMTRLVDALVGIQVGLFALDDSVFSVLFHAVRESGMVGASASRATVRGFIRSFGHGDKAFREAGSALRRLHENESTMVWVLLEVLNSWPEIDHQRVTLALFPELESHCSRSIHDLIDSLKNGDDIQRRTVAIVMAMIGPDAVEAIPALSQATDDPNECVSLWVQWALKVISQEWQ